MKKIGLYILGILIILLVVFTIESKATQESICFDDYLIELEDEYGNDKKGMLDKIKKEIVNNKNSKEFIGINLLAREYYLFLWRENEELIKYADETERYLKKYDMQNELLDFYSIMSSKYIGNENYNMGYLYIDRGEYIAKNMYEKTKSKEILSTLVAIKYLKAVIAQDIGMEDESEIVFKEAGELRSQGVRERVDIYTNILLYYYNRDEYTLVEEYAIKIIKLIEYNSEEESTYKNDYIRAKIILAENYIYIDKINKSIEIINELSKDINIFEENIYIDKIYYLYSRLYKESGNLQESIKYLKKAYEEIKDTDRKSAKIKIVKSIIEELELTGDKEELLYWYKIENYIFTSSESLLETQYLLSQIIDTDLDNANTSIKVLKLQKSKMIYFIISLLLIISIIVITLIIDKKRKRLLKENIIILEENISINQKYYENIKMNNEDIKRIKHDIKNHMIVINKLISEKDYNHVVNYIKSIVKNIDDNSLDINTNNKIIDAIIWSKSPQFKLENIDFSLDIKIPQNIDVDDLDLCVIYGNILDNAYEACKRINDDRINKYIKLKSIIKGSYLFIDIKNSYVGNIKVRKGILKTNKNDELNHGIGIENIKKSIKKYDGDIKISYKDNEFQVSIIMNINS